MNLILFGCKGCGKTYFGNKCSEATHRPFLDTDDLLFPGKGARELYLELGESRFRSLEARTIEGLLGVRDSIIAVGGGAVLLPRNVEILQQIGSMVYLKVHPQIIKNRIVQNGLPAFLSHEDEIDRWIEARLAIYESIQAKWMHVDQLDELTVLKQLISCFI